jgi:hypothetical protein
MRPITFICALAATLQLLSGTALAGGWTWPIRGPVITAYRNGDDPYASGQHRGVDIAAPVGSRVVAATSGTVTFAGVVGSAGLVVSERTADGRFDLSHLHLSSLSVRRGESVPEGAEVGTVGTSGQRSAEAPHLHFGVRDAGERSAYRDPLDFLGPPAGGRPDPAPAPAPVPVGHPAVADPAPAPSSAPSPAPVPVRAPGIPLGGRVPSLVPSGALARGVAPRTVLHRHAAGGRLPHELAPPVTRATGHTGPHVDRSADTRSAQIAPAATGPHGEASSPASRHMPTARPARHSHHGLNIGWLAACIGLIALATVLGHPGGTRKAAARGRATPARARAAAARGRATLGALLRPDERGGPTR